MLRKSSRNAYNISSKESVSPIYGQWRRENMATGTKQRCWESEKNCDYHKLAVRKAKSLSWKSARYRTIELHTNHG